MRVSTHHLIPQQPEPISIAPSIPDIGMGDASTEQGQSSNADVEVAGPSGDPPSPSAVALAAANIGNADAPIDIESLPDPLPTNAQSSTAPSLRQQASHNMLPSFPSSYGIDIIAEAAKLPLDVAVFNSARSAGGEEKLRKYLQSILVVGGGALVPGMQHAVESRSVRSIVAVLFSTCLLNHESGTTGYRP
jgi:actin-related protein 8